VGNIETIIKQLQDMYAKRAALEKEILAFEKKFVAEAKASLKIASAGVMKSAAKKPVKKAAKPAGKPLLKK